MLKTEYHKNMLLFEGLGEGRSGPVEGVFNVVKERLVSPEKLLEW